MTHCFSQSFEGKIVYRLSIESSDPKKISQEQIEMMFKDADTLCVLYIKGDHYKFVTLDLATSNVKAVNQYDPVSNKIYDYRPSDQQHLVRETENSTIKYKTRKVKIDNISILGQKCHSVTIDYGSHSTKIYVSDKFKVNRETIRNNAPSFLQYIRECESIPLKIIMTGGGAVHNLVLEAIDILEEPIDSNVFDLPETSR
ncbi:MAG TPA: hypothetical protein VFZ33_17690 [Chitinophagaceae bacterium]